MAKRVMIKPGNDYEKIRVLSVCENKKPKSYNCTCLICGNNFTHSGLDILKYKNSGCPLCVENSDVFSELSRNTLTNKQKEIYDFLKFGMSAKDISEKLGCSTQNVYQIISTARKRNDKQQQNSPKPRIDWGMYANMDLSQLNETEIKILLHVASGGERRLIADDLGISISSVGAYLRRAMLKLNGEMDAYKKMTSERNKNEYKNNLEYRESRKKYSREYRKMNKSKRNEYMRKYRKTENGAEYERGYIKKYYKKNPQVCYNIEKNIIKKFKKFQVTIMVDGKRIFCSFDDLDSAKKFRNAVNSMREKEIFWSWFQGEYPELFGKIFDN